jgi:hypothetical protein
MNIKHSKYKNTGILFELLVRQVTADTLNGANSQALNIIKTFFAKSELGKELKLYEALNKNTQLHESQASILINTLLESSSKLNRSILRREKYNLINEIKKHYNLEEFFKYKIPNYKAFASFYNLLEINNTSDFVNPELIVNNKITLLEYLSSSPISEEKVTNDILEDFKKQDQDVRILAYKLMLEKFNGKYANLYPSQKEILKEFITSVESTSKLKSFYNERVNLIKEELNTILKGVDNKVVAIKLEEVLSLIKEIEKPTPITNEDITNLLMYAELLEEFRSINGKSTI